MKIFYIAALAMLPAFAHAQTTDALPSEETPRIEEDTLITTSGFRIGKGQDVKLGRGTLPSGDFKYITISGNSWVSIASASSSPSYTPTPAVGRKWNGHLFQVKRFRKEGSKKRGYTYYLVLGGGNIVNYECDIESAIATGEIEVPEQYRPQQPAQAIQIHQQPSLADELKKLKGLLDEGILTQEEYDEQKRKLLGK